MEGADRQCWGIRNCSPTVSISDNGGEKEEGGVKSTSNGGRPSTELQGGNKRVDGGDVLRSNFVIIVVLLSCRGYTRSLWPDVDGGSPEST